MTIDNEAYRYLSHFKGEDQMVRAVNLLNRESDQGGIGHEWL